MANPLENKLVVAEPDFDTIRANFKNFLRSQSTFTDYDFEGSGMANLIDLLAYNTHYMAFYANMLANESFLDTASIRNAVVSHAKMLGYTPSSRKSATAVVNLTFPLSTNPSVAGMTSLTIPRFTKFASTAINGVNYMFLNLDDVTVTKTGTDFVFSNLRITEGKAVNYVYSYNQLTNPDQEFVLPDANIDTDSLEVVIQNSAVDLTQATYARSTDATTVTSTAKVYYLDETRDGKYKIYFGDNLLGKSLTDGNIVILSYVISSGEVANKATGFKLVNTVGGLSSGTVTVTSVAAGGSEAETIDRIKFTSTKNYVSNNRAVTKNDYIALIQREYPALEAINVWGGEENVPPVYGKIFVSAKPAAGYEISTAEKQYILNDVIAPMNIVTVTPEFVNPDFNYVNVNVDINYDPTATGKTSGQIESTVKTAIRDFANTNLDTFNSYFKISRLMRDIDNSDTSITSNQVSIKLEKRLEPVLGVTRTYTLDFSTSLKKAAGKTRIYSTPAFTGYDSELNYRRFFIEEVPQSSTGISSIEIDVPGSGFTSAPTILIEGDGLGAKAHSVITNGKVTSVIIDAAGSEYTTASAKAYVNGVVQSNVILRAVVDNKIGTLRSYYFDDNNIKTIYSTNVGSVNYDTGVITLNNFMPVDIEDGLKRLRFYATPESNLFQSSRNSIITIDLEDQAAISVTTSAV